MTHSPEPWATIRHPICGALGRFAATLMSSAEDPLFIVDANRDSVHTKLVVQVEDDGLFCGMTPDDARRIVAAVNFCAGIPTHILLERDPDKRPGIDREGRDFTSPRRIHIDLMPTSKCRTTEEPPP